MLYCITKTVLRRIKLCCFVCVFVVLLDILICLHVCLCVFMYMIPRTRVFSFFFLPPYGQNRSYHTCETAWTHSRNPWLRSWSSVPCTTDENYPQTIVQTSCHINHILIISYPYQSYAGRKSSVFIAIIYTQQDIPLKTPWTDDLYDVFPLQQYSSWSRSARQGRQMPDLYDLYDLAHVAGWEPCNLHDLYDLYELCNLYDLHDLFPLQQYSSRSRSARQGR